MAHQSGARHKVCSVAWLGYLLVLILLVSVYLTAPGRAQQVSNGLPEEPILRIETGQHGAAIRRIDTDAQNRIAVTVLPRISVRMV
jgi:hypothetical protein